MAETVRSPAPGRSIAAFTGAALALFCAFAHAEADPAPVAGVSSAAEPRAEEGLSTGRREKAPAFLLRDVDGTVFDLERNLGREVILLDFWATFCLPCLAELNSFRDLQTRYGSKGFRVVAVSVDQPQTQARVRAFAKGKAYPFAVLSDPGQDAYRLYGVSALPTSILIDAQGRIAYRQEGYQPGDEGRMEQRVRSLLAEAASADSASRTASATATLPDSSKASLIAGTPVPMDTRITKPSPAEGFLSRLSMNGSNFLRSNYGREDASQPDPNGWLEDWFDLRIAEGALSYQLRYRMYQFLRDLPGDGEELIRDPNHRVVKQGFAYAGNHADIRAGNVYGIAARGMLFRFFEDRQARLDKDLNGIWAALQSGEGSGLGNGRVSVFGGKTFSKFPDLHTVDAEEDRFRDLYLQGTEASWQPWVGALSVGGQYAEAFREGWNARLAGGNLEWVKGPTNAYAGYIGIAGEDKFNFPHEYDGRAFYASLSENLGRLEAGAEYKYYRDYDLGFTDPPSLVPFHTFRLMAREMLFPNNQAEDGFQARGAWHFTEASAYALNVARLTSHPERNPALLIHHVELPYLDVDQQISLPFAGGGSGLIDLNWIRQRKFSEGEFQDIDAYTAGFTGDHPLGSLILEAEAELQYMDAHFRDPIPGDPASGRLGETGAVASSDQTWQGVLALTVGRAPLWSLTLDYEATTSDREADPDSFHYLLGGITNGWPSAYLTLDVSHGNRVTLWGGRRKERVVCSGGSCRVEPAFEGAELIWSSHF